MRVSGFSFMHNCVAGGYPFVEAIKMVRMFVDEIVVVDMQSTDETRRVLEKIDVRIVDGKWLSGESERCLDLNYLLHRECTNDVIWFFEADEVFSGELAQCVNREIQHEKNYQIAVYRLQVEQNFQRCRWYPDQVHRVFKKGSTTRSGHTTKEHFDRAPTIKVISPEHGFLWDVTNCFRDDWVMRIKQNADLWGELPRYRYVPYHFTYAPIELAEGQQQSFLEQEQWTWKKSPFDLPTLLRSLVGVMSYREHLRRMNLL